MKTRMLTRRGLAGALGALTISLAVTSSALATPPATNSVTQEITGGTLTASVASANLNSVTYSNSQQMTYGTLTLDVNDARGSSAGWSVSIESSDFVYAGSSVTGVNIPNVGFTVVNPQDPSKTAGQGIDPTSGPFAMGGGSLDQARTTIGAEAGFGSGIYEQDLDVSLVVPPLSQTGLYTATLVVSTNAAP